MSLRRPRSDPWTISRALPAEQGLGVSDNPASFPNAGKEVGDCLGDAAGLLELTQTITSEFEHRQGERDEFLPAPVLGGQKL